MGVGVVKARCTHLLEDRNMLFEEGMVYDFEKYIGKRNRVYVYRAVNGSRTVLIKFSNASYIPLMKEYGFGDYYCFDDYFAELKNG